MTDDSDDSNEDMLEAELLISPVKQQKQPSRKALVQGEDGEYYHAREVGRAETPTDVSSSEEESEDEVSPPPNARTRQDSSIIPWAQRVGVEPQRMHVMQTALFRMPEEDAALQPSNSSRKLLALPTAFGMNRKHSRDSDGEGLRSDLQQVGNLMYYL